MTGHGASDAGLMAHGVRPISPIAVTDPTCGRAVDSGDAHGGRHQQHAARTGATPQKEQVFTMKQLLMSLVRDDQGQDLIEYALLAGFISLATVAAVTSVGTSLNTVYGSISSKVDAAGK